MTPLITTADVALRLNVDEKTVRALVDAGEMYWEAENPRRISEGQLRLFIDAHKTSGAVYFIRARTSGFIKIGIARSVSSRLKALQTANPEQLELMAFTTVANGRSLERELHRRLAEFRMSGEWFRPAEWSDRIQHAARKTKAVREAAVRKAILS